MKIKVLFLIVIAFFATTTSAKELTQKEMLRAISTASNSINTIRCSFTQTTTSAFLNNNIVSKGKMQFSNQGKLRWEYGSPYNYLLILNNGKMKMSSPKGTKTIDMKKNKKTQKLLTLIDKSLNGNFLSDSKMFNIQVVAKEGEWIVEMTPIQRDMKHLFTKLYLYVNPIEAQIKSVKMEESSGDSTIIQFSNIEKNIKLDDSVFKL